MLEKIKDTQDAIPNKTTQRKNVSRLREYLSFCEGLGIKAADTLPAREEVLLAWASSFAGRLAGKTVGTKLLAIRKEHEMWDALVWRCSSEQDHQGCRGAPASFLFSCQARPHHNLNVGGFE